MTPPGPVDARAPLKPLITALAAALIALGQAVAPAGAADKPESVPDRVWTTIAPAGDTGCSDGSPYSFHVRPAAPDKLVIYFNGGGACWSGATCDPTAKAPAYTPTATAQANDPRIAKGIFDLARADNPLRDWSLVFISYCTGDVHLGGRDADYQTPDGRAFTIRHRGRANARAALDWTFAHWAKPARILVAGSSAGALALPYYVGMVATHYPKANIALLGDGAGGYRSSTLGERWRQWGIDGDLPPWLAAVPEAERSLESLLIADLRAFPRLRLALYDTANDVVQRRFRELGGDTGAVEADLRRNRAATAAGVHDLISYVAGGGVHTMLRSQVLYEYKVQGVGLADWVGDVASGRPTRSADCILEAAGCATPPPTP